MDNIDWENEYPIDENSPNALALEAKDFVFSVNDTSDGAYVLIIPKKFFAKNNCMYDQHISHLIERWLPTCLFEDCECMFTDSEDTKVKDVEAYMLNAGFVKSNMLQVMSDLDFREDEEDY